MIVNDENELMATTEAATEPDSIFSVFRDQPPPWVGWIVALVVVVTLVMRIAIWLGSKKSRRDDIYRRREDEYWFRSVILDGCLERIKTFSDNVNKLIEKAIQDVEEAAPVDNKPKIYSQFMSAYRVEQNSAIFGLAELCVFDENYYTDCVLLFEDLENRLVQAMGAEVISGASNCAGLRAIKVQTTRISLLKYLKGTHSKLFR